MAAARRCALLAPLSLLCLSLTASPAVGADWPGWRGPNRDGKSPDTGLLKEWPAGGPPLALVPAEPGVHERLRVLGEVLAALREQDLLESTLVVFLAICMLGGAGIVGCGEDEEPEVPPVALPSGVVCLSVRPMASAWLSIPATLIVSMPITSPSATPKPSVNTPSAARQLLEDVGLTVFVAVIGVNAGAHMLDALKLANEAGHPRAVNTVMLGAFSNYLDFSEEDWKKAIEARVPPKTVDINLRAFELGRKAGAE